MKKVFLIIVFLVFGLSTSAQEKINIDNLIGYWKPSEESTQLFFWKDIQGNLQMQEISQTSGDELDLITLREENDKLFVVTNFAPEDYTVESTYSFLDQNTIICIVKGQENSTLIYKRIK